jgi:hypothetical protein
MAPIDALTCGLDDPDAESTFRQFTDRICRGASQRYAMLSYHAVDGARCLLETSGRCLAADTPWRMARLMVEPLFRFDPSVEWVALFPVENWSRRCDDALRASFSAGVSWARLLARELAAELESKPRLIICR